MVVGNASTRSVLSILIPLPSLPLVPSVRGRFAASSCPEPVEGRVPCPERVEGGGPEPVEGRVVSGE